MVTKKGAPMGYITLEDFTGEIEVVVFPSAWEKYSELLRNDAAILLSGRVQANERTVHIPVSYTHLDVYKRQVHHWSSILLR